MANNVPKANSILFTKSQRNAVIMSNIGIAAMVYGVVQSASMYGWWNVIALYGIPWLEVSHWCKCLYATMDSTQAHR